MIDLADFQRRVYHDGPDIPETPELQTAEREYRKAFLAAAREAAAAIGRAEFAAAASRLSILFGLFSLG